MFKKGDIVWAKIDGFPWWPSYVEVKVNEEKYKVLFLGEKSYQTIKKEKLKEWNENYLNFTEKIKKNKKTQKFFVAVELGSGLRSGLISYSQHDLFLSNCSKKLIEYSEEGVKEFIEYCKNQKTAPKIKKQVQNGSEKYIEGTKVVPEPKNEQKPIDNNYNTIIVEKKKLTQNNLIKERNEKVSSPVGPKKKSKHSSQVLTPMKNNNNKNGNIETPVNYNGSIKQNNISTQRQCKITSPQITQLDFSNELLQICINQTKIKEHLDYIYSQLEKINSIKDKFSKINFNQRQGNFKIKKELLLYLEFICSIFQIPKDVNNSLLTLSNEMKKFSKSN